MWNTRFVRTLLQKAAVVGGKRIMVVKHRSHDAKPHHHNNNKKGEKRMSLRKRILYGMTLLLILRIAYVKRQIDRDRRERKLQRETVVLGIGTRKVNAREINARIYSMDETVVPFVFMVYKRLNYFKQGACVRV